MESKSMKEETMELLQAEDQQEALKQVNDMREANGMNVKPNRAERKKQIKFFKKELAAHQKRKPSIDLEEEDPEEQQKAIFRIQAWATRSGILIKKLTDLGYEFTSHTERVYKQAASAGRKAAEELKETGGVKVGDMQLMPAPDKEDTSVQ